MDTLKYNYGETPKDVICERLAYCITDESLAEPADRLANWHSNMPQWAFVNADALITVLDALVVAAWGDHDSKRVTHGDPFQLRIDILAALGIDEGGN